MGGENSLPRNLSATSGGPFRSSSLGFILWQNFLPPRERGEALGEQRPGSEAVRRKNTATIETPP
jgi:hypothetical protein